MQVNPLFGTIYNSIYLLANSIHNARKAGMQLSGSNLAYFVKNTTFNGFNQKYQVDTRGEVKTNYIILDTDGKGSRLYQTHMVDLREEVLRFAGRSINFPGGSPPPPDSRCWFETDAICTGGMRLREVNILTSWHSSIDLICHIVNLCVLTLRCGGDVHHNSVGCHPQSGDRRVHLKSLCQVWPVNTIWFMI